MIENRVDTPIENPYNPSDATERNNGPGRPPIIAWSFVPLPPLLTAVTMLSVQIIPPGPGWMIIQLLMLSVVPWIVGSLAAGMISIYLLPPRWRFVLIITYIPLLLVTWAAMWRVLVTSWT